jgi:hypothetical protein
MKHRNTRTLKRILKLKAAWRRNIIEVDTTEHRRDSADGSYDFIRILGIETE